MVSDCEIEKKVRMSTVQTLVLRTSIVLGMVAAVVTILYFTPMPDQSFQSCDRPCHALDWPMICRVKLNIEMYQTMSGVCKDCPSNSSNCDNKFCATADGSARGVITANRQLPGPPIQVCHNDVMVIDVINKIPGHNIALHWRGQPNSEAPFMDGVPMVTQCPITSYTTFQYRFRASAPGTHFYHSYADSDRADGIFGAFVVRQADKMEPHRKLYDVDSKDHVLLLSEWSGDFASEYGFDDDKPKSILINGKGPESSFQTLLKVSQGKRYRFRVAYTSGTVGCPMTLSVKKHLLKIIAVDGHATKPYEASSITLSKGERLDFVLKCNQQVGDYRVKVSSECLGSKLNGQAIIRYDSHLKSSKAFKRSVQDISEKVRNFDTIPCEGKMEKVCVGDVALLEKLPERLRENIDRRIYLSMDYRRIDETEDLYSDLVTKMYRINNLTFTYPSSPILTQPFDVPISSTCNELKIPHKCQMKNICECIHLEHIPLGASVELVLVNADADKQEHVFHLHGYHFYVVGYHNFEEKVSITKIKDLVEDDTTFKRNLISPVLKDTVRVPENSVVVIRFLANNPGFWMLRDEKSKSWTRGMDMIFQVGSYSDIVSTPSSFPTCGSYVGPEFFLI